MKPDKTEEEKRTEETTGASHDKRTPGMWLGFAMFVSGAILNFTAFAFAPASVLAPLEGSQFASHFIFAVLTKNKNLWDPQTKKWSQERLLWIGGGTLLLIGGVVLPVMASPSTVARFDVPSLWCLWRGWKWWATVSAGAIIFVVCMATAYRRSATLLANKNSQTPLADKNSQTRIDQLIFTGSATVAGAFGVVQAKIISELVELLFGGDTSILTTWLFWQTLILLLFGFSFWLVQLNNGPKRFSQLSIIPLLQGFYILFSSLGGGVFFEDFELFGAQEAWMFAGGMGLVVLGLYCIVPTHSGGITRTGAGGVPVVFSKSEEASKPWFSPRLTGGDGGVYQKLPGVFIS